MVNGFSQFIVTSWYVINVCKCYLSSYEDTLGRRRQPLHSPRTRTTLKQMRNGEALTKVVLVLGGGHIAGAGAGAGL